MSDSLLGWAVTIPVPTNRSQPKCDRSVGNQRDAESDAGGGFGPVWTCRLLTCRLWGCPP